MNESQLYYFLVDKNTRNILQIEYPSNIDEFNKILGTSEGKGDLLKDLGIIRSNETRVFKNPIAVQKPATIAESAKTKRATKDKSTKKPAMTVGEKKLAKKVITKNKTVETAPVQVDLFAGLLD